MKKLIIRMLIVVAVLAAAWGGYHLFRQLPQRQQQIPTAKVRQGEVTIRAFSRGELRAVRSVTLTAPNLFGTVQVTRLAPLGALAREKALIVEFDDSEVRARLEEKELELEQVDEQIKKAEAELAIRSNQDQVELLRAQYSVRRAELEKNRNELLSRIDARKNELNLEEAQRRLKQLESDIKSRLEQAKAEIAVLREQRNKAVIEMSREKTRLSQTRLLSPIGGLVFIHPNRFGGGRMFGMQVPDIREGDQVQPGMPIADVLDLSELEVIAKIGELDRANLREGQELFIQLDALAGKRIRGQIKSMSGTASANIWSGDPSKKFDVLFSVDMKQLLSTVGATPEQIQRVLAAAERNRNKPQAQPRPSFAMFGGPAGGFPSGAPGAAGGGPEGGAGQTMSLAGMGPAGSGGPGRRDSQPGGGGAGRGEGRGRGMSGQGGGQMSDQDRQKMREAFQKELGGRNMQDLSQEERQKIFAKLRQSTPGSAGQRREGGGTAPASTAGGPPTPGAGPGMPFFGGPPSEFTEKELAEAQLPPPPEEDSQLEVLLRPGLLADVEITVEKLPNAIYIPAQAIFEKDGKPIVYVQSGRRFEERSVTLLRRSEATMVVSTGLKPGEMVALADPNARKGDKNSGKPGGGQGPMGGAPAAGKS
jgi:multidrug efflux pump subunit AcrA (membrane-fusion protein)